MKIEWKRKTGPFQNGTSCYLGKVAVGSIDWDSCTKDFNYKIRCGLPQTKINFTNFETEIEAKEKLILILNSWLSAIGIEDKIYE